MTASITFYNNWKAAVDEAVLRTATVKLTLHTSSYSPNAATHAVYADLTNELSTANGYTNGGQSLASITWNQTSGTAKFDAADTVWTASGGSIVARYGVLRVVGTINGQVDPLMAYVLMDTTPADVTTTTGNTLTFQWNASGIFTLA
jgi:hypothetical protein